MNITTLHVGNPEIARGGELPAYLIEEGRRKEKIQKANKKVGRRRKSKQTYAKDEDEGKIAEYKGKARRNIMACARDRGKRRGS